MCARGRRRLGEGGVSWCRGLREEEIELPTSETLHWASSYQSSSVRSGCHAVAISGPQRSHGCAQWHNYRQADPQHLFGIPSGLCGMQRVSGVYTVDGRSALGTAFIP